MLCEVAQLITEQEDGTPDGELRSRLCAAIFLIGKLPAVGTATTGLRATPAILADLLVSDLPTGSNSLRRRIPELLDTLVETGTLTRVDDEYRLPMCDVTPRKPDDSARDPGMADDTARVAEERTSELRKMVAAKLNGVSQVGAARKTRHDRNIHFGAEAPPMSGTLVSAWGRGNWSVLEQPISPEAQPVCPDSPSARDILPQLTPTTDCSNCQTRMTRESITCAPCPKCTSRDADFGRHGEHPFGSPDKSCSPCQAISALGPQVGSDAISALAWPLSPPDLVRGRRSVRTARKRTLIGLALLAVATVALAVGMGVLGVPGQRYAQTTTTLQDTSGAMPMAISTPPTPVPHTPTPAPPSTTTVAPPTPDIRVVTASGDGLYLRPKPDAAVILTVIPDKAMVVVLGPRQEAAGQEWTYIRLANGQQGWVASAYLAPIPAVTATP